MYLRYSRTKKRLPRHIKTKSSKSTKIDIFATRLTHGFEAKTAIFQTFFFRQYSPAKCLLRDSRKKKRLSRHIITRSSKSRKIDIFYKGVNPWFLSKNGNFSTFFFLKYRPRKCLLRYSRTKRSLSNL